MSEGHQWCRDVRRDEAVRAAEDAAAVPSIQHRDLPEQVALLWASVGDIIGRVVRLEGEMDAGQDDSASPAEGLRTERVTLEVTQRVDHYVSPSRWNWCRQLGSHAQPGESVRVVDEADAASDEAVAHGATLSALAEARESLAAANRGIARLTAERDAARARVAELEAAPPPRGWLTEEMRDDLDEALEWLNCQTNVFAKRAAAAIATTLARETPPRVKMPPASTGETPLVRDLMWGEAIRAAGVEVEG